MSCPDVVTISYEDLVAASAAVPSPNNHKNNNTNNDTTHATTSHLQSCLLEKIGQAFGDGVDCLGLLAVTDVPDATQFRRTLLPLARKLATLPSPELQHVISESSGYQVGWSHGKERVEGHEKFDTAKGSFYANPITDDLVESMKQRYREKHSRREGGGRRRGDGDGSCNHSLEVVADKPCTRQEERDCEEETYFENLEQTAKDNPALFAPNVWPTESLPELENALKEMGMLICQVGRLVARHCDAYVSLRCPGYTPRKLESIVTNSLCCKARLLHYFAMEENDSESNDNRQSTEHGETPLSTNDTDFSSWCGWHNDHGSLTGLVPAMYLDANGREVSCPDKSAGLYIKSRSGKLFHVQLPLNSLAFQIGETSQIHTGGILQATPHAVRGISQGQRPDDVGLITRESFAVFMEPEYFDDMNIPEGRTVEDTQGEEVEKYLPKTVNPLRSRWKPGMNFGEFSNATFAAFY